MNIFKYLNFLKKKKKNIDFSKKETLEKKTLEKKTLEKKKSINDIITNEYLKDLQSSFDNIQIITDNQKNK